MLKLISARYGPCGSIKRIHTHAGLAEVITTWGQSGAVVIRLEFDRRRPKVPDGKFPTVRVG